MVRITKQISSFTQKDIQELFKNTRLVVMQPPLLIRIGPAKKSVGRLLVVTPKAVGSAPIRNKLRRRLKSLFYQEKFYSLGKDCIILARQGAGELTYEQLHTLLLNTLSSSTTRTSAPTKLPE